MRSSRGTEADCERLSAERVQPYPLKRTHVPGRAALAAVPDQFAHLDGAALGPEVGLEALSDLDRVLARTVRAAVVYDQDLVRPGGRRSKVPGLEVFDRGSEHNLDPVRLVVGRDDNAQFDARTGFRGLMGVMRDKVREGERCLRGSGGHVGGLGLVRHQFPRGEVEEGGIQLQAEASSVLLTVQERQEGRGERSARG